MERVDILINKEHPLDKSFIPSNLVITDENENNFHDFLNPELKPMIKDFVFDAFNSFNENAILDGFDYAIDSGYRSYEYQQLIWDYNVAKIGLKKTKNRVALPGCSEHQTGLAIDIASVNYGILCSDLNDKEISYLMKNIYKYGFVLRYPAFKEKITGYDYEPWHYRFVGVDLAKYLTEKRLTLEEHYKRILRKK
jgi:zinc D-Ala-D-Ala carboxypeptidase